jgi:hypothetical protein
MYKTRELIVATIWAILPYPSLYLTGFTLYKSTKSTEGNILTRILPSKRYIEFRLHTQYGDTIPSKETLRKDIHDYISWVKNYK